MVVEYAWSMTDVWLINGMPGAGKTTVSRLLAGAMTRGVHIEGEQLQEWIITGGVWPGDEPADEASAQIGLTIRNQCLLAAVVQRSRVHPRT